MAFVALALAFALAPGVVRSAQLGDSPFAPPGQESPAVRALAAAHRAFLHDLPARSEHDSAIQRFIVDPDNYRITISRGDGHYLIDYALKPFEGSGFRDGGYRYVVEAGRSRIIERSLRP